MNSALDQRPSPRRTVALGALTIGTVDILWAMANSAFNGRGPIWVFQSVAGGLHGSATFQGGFGTAVQGMLIHYFIASCVMTTYFLAGRRVPALTRYPAVCGIAYGIAVYVVMYQIVLPLSAYHSKGITWGVPLAKGLFIHMFGVGLPAALAARAAAAAR